MPSNYYTAARFARTEDVIAVLNTERDRLNERAKKLERRANAYRESALNLQGAARYFADQRHETTL